jgi:hypothetical protein
MSFTKNTIEQLIKASNQIQTESIEDNDLTDILEGLNVVIEISERISKNDKTTDFYWNEIITELIAVIHSAISGYSKLGLTGLRNILELVCHSFFYYDHQIELKLSINENIKADKYVSALINDFMFFTSKYINTFYDDIEKLEHKPDSISGFLKIEYSALCDVVHGRHKTLLKKDLSIKYDKISFKKFETHFLNITSVISNMYIVRHNDFNEQEIIKISKRLKLLKL